MYQPQKKFRLPHSCIGTTEGRTVGYGYLSEIPVNLCPDPSKQQVVKLRRIDPVNWQSRLFGQQIQGLINCKAAGEQAEPQLTQWLEQVPARSHKRFVEIGLLNSNRTAAARPMSLISNRISSLS
jgi:hypothetical protein